MSDIDELKRDIIVELANAYFESYRSNRPNDSVEQLSAFVRDLATNDVDELLTAQDRNSSIAQTKRIRNLIQQQGAGSWQRIIELELQTLQHQADSEKELT